MAESKRYIDILIYTGPERGGNTPNFIMGPTAIGGPIDALKAYAISKETMSVRHTKLLYELSKNGLVAHCSGFEENSKRFK